MIAKGNFKTVKEGAALGPPPTGPLQRLEQHDGALKYETVIAAARVFTE